MTEKVVTHWLKSRDAEKASCGASSRDLLYSSDPSGDMVTCKACLYNVAVKAGSLPTQPDNKVWHTPGHTPPCPACEQATQVYPACSDCGKEIRKTPPKQVFVCKECAAKSRQDYI